MMTDKYLILVNKNNKMIDKKIFEIVEYKTIDTKVYIEKETLNSFLKLKNKIKKEGYIIDIESGYRTIEHQEKVLNEIIEEKSIEYAKKYVAVPGYSEHHTGLAIDILLYENGKIYCDHSLKNHKVLELITKYAPQYGFIIRYPKKKKKITGYNYEPWHLRYLKNKKIAKYITDNNLTLEEFLDISKSK